MTNLTDAAYAAADEVSLPDDSLADVAQAAEATLNVTTADDAEAAAETDPVLANAPRTPRRGSFQERIDEVTRARREAERERDFWRQEASTHQETAPQAATQADDAPHPAHYQYGEQDAAFIRDHARFEARREIAQTLMHEAARHEAAATHAAWADRQAQFAQAAPDYYAVFDRDWPCSPAMADAISTSDDGPAVAYHLASNPAEARRIFGLKPIAQVRELGRIEAAVSRGGNSATSHFAVSNAPAPPPQARGGGGRFRVSPDTDDFASFDRTY